MARSVQTSVRLPSALYDQLVAAAGDKGLGEEIRERLEASFKAQPVALGNETEAQRLFDEIDRANWRIEEAFYWLRKLPLEQVRAEAQRRVEYEGAFQSIRGRSNAFISRQTFNLTKTDGDKDE